MVGNGKLVDNIQVADHDAELLKRNLTVKVSVRLHNSSVDELLKLDVVQVAADHHLKDLEELAVGDVVVIVNVIDLEGKSEFVFLTGTSTERVQSLYELQERDVSIVVSIEDSNDTSHEWVVRKLGNFEEFRWLESATLIAVNLTEILV